MLPALNVPVDVKSTLPVAAMLHETTNGEVVTEVVVIVFDEPQLVKPLKVKLLMLKVPPAAEAPPTIYSKSYSTS